MGRSEKYTLEDINNVKELINNHRMNKKQAIKAAGFCDSSSYYLLIKRLKLKEQIYFVKNTDFNFI